MVNGRLLHGLTYMKIMKIIKRSLHPAINEEDNVEDLYNEVKEIFSSLSELYTYEHIFIDNASSDQTVLRLKELVQKDENVRIIVNSRNFGHIRSPYYAMFQARGDAVILLACDRQEPPSLIADFVKKWEGGSTVVIGKKTSSDENPLMFGVRKTLLPVDQPIF